MGHHRGTRDKRVALLLEIVNEHLTDLLARERGIHLVARGGERVERVVEKRDPLRVEGYLDG